MHTKTLIFSSGYTADAVIKKWLHALQSGTPWSTALFEAIGDWPIAEEYFDGRYFAYLIDNEAFDWLLLAERMINQAIGMVPIEEAERLLFHGELPLGITEEDIQKAFGEPKYHAHLNYFYGVVIEEALWQATESDLIKQNGIKGFQTESGFNNDVFEILYGAPFKKLFSEFYRSKKRRLPIKHKLSEIKSFSYWCFKRRVANSDNSRVASDTKKGLEILKRMRGGQ